jgi:hypothetical protein
MEQSTTDGFRFFFFFFLFFFFFFRLNNFPLTCVSIVGQEYTMEANIQIGILEYQYQRNHEAGRALKCTKVITEKQKDKERSREFHQV